MEWLNIRLSILRSPEYVGSSPVERATWLSVLSYSVDQENGGRIAGGALWKDRQWQQTCGVTLREVKNAARLIIIDGNDVVIWCYPVDKELEVKMKREAGRIGGSAKTEAKAQAARINGTQAQPKLSLASALLGEPKHNPSTDPTEGEGEGNRKDKGIGIGIGVGQNDPAADAAPTSSELPLSDESKAAKPEKQTDTEWIAELTFDPAYTGIDVPREHNKCIRWCSEHGKQPTRRRFVNWLNRCDKPMQGVGGALMR